MSTLKKSASHFHHGSLESALVSAGVRQVERFGLNSLGLRQLALVTGVSPTAVYRHFADLEHLKAAVAKASREELGIMMVSALTLASKAQTPQGAVARFLALGGAYIDFGIKKRNLFEIAFICFESPPLAPDSPNPWELLMDAFTEMKKFECISNQTLKTGPMVAWSMVHGYAGLAAQGATGNGRETARFKEQVLRAVLKALDIQKTAKRR